ncbi:hypothetical protein [Legionella waltersii]|uniref:Uncharacterized protein n=1 Tax=Legionella waltersii TaxID=66969 RepID=A0A0W1ANL8_9GAMM|nr:hypothetical protein [Legionella waltersii]KTD82939.1 hypothetical protein Lwal_0417 [Legionella waltersii]SNV02436.1 Uncharacterised protein [Legionella waltersii]
MKKATKILPAFNTSVLYSLTQTSTSSLFAGSSLSFEFFRLSNTPKESSLSDLTSSLPSAPDLAYRGSHGSREAIEALQTDCLGKSSVQDKKASSLSLPSYVRDNNSRYFFSLTPCRTTVQPYAAGLSLIPCKGVIWVTGLPKVFVRPQKLLHLNRPMFEKDDQIQVDGTSLDEARTFQSITTMTERNNELTAVVGTSSKENWSLKPSRDVMSLIQVCGPGRILSRFMSSSQPFKIKEWHNPQFARRVWALDIVTAPRTDYDMMNKNAKQLKLITPGSRLLTLEDACAICSVPELESLNDSHTVGETLQFNQVPKHIPVGDARQLSKFLLSQIEKSATLQAIVSAYRFTI